jgi:hypothetical protein
LDVFTAKKAADGYEMNYQASKDALQDKLSPDEARLGNVEGAPRTMWKSGSRWRGRIETIQKKKLEAERDQLTVGRSTQFQCRITRRITPSPVSNAWGASGEAVSMGGRRVDDGGRSRATGAEGDVGPAVENGKNEVSK